MHLPRSLWDAAKRAAQPLLSPACSGVHQRLCSHSCWNQASLVTTLGLGLCGAAGFLTAGSSWGLLALICALDEALLWEPCWLMYRQTIVHFPASFSQPAPPACNSGLLWFSSGNSAIWCWSTAPGQAFLKYTEVIGGCYCFYSAILLWEDGRGCPVIICAFGTLHLGMILLSFLFNSWCSQNCCTQKTEYMRQEL